MVVGLVSARPDVGGVGLRQSLLLERHVGLEIDGGGFDRLVAQPQSDDRAVDAVMEEVHRQGMAKDMRCYVLVRNEGR